MPEVERLERQLAPYSQTSEHRTAINAAVRRGLLVSRGFNGMSDTDRREFLTEWVDTLVQYSPDQVRQAWQDYYKSDHPFPDLAAIVRLIEERRKLMGLALAGARREMEDAMRDAEEEARQRELEDDPMTDEQRQKVQDILLEYKRRSNRSDT